MLRIVLRFGIALLVTKLLSALMLGWLASQDLALYLEEKFTMVEVSTLVLLSCNAFSTNFFFFRLLCLSDCCLLVGDLSGGTLSSWLVFTC